MPNAIHMLKQALQFKNWPMVIASYETLSGEEYIDTNSEQEIKPYIEPSMLDVDVDEEEQEEAKIEPVLKRKRGRPKKEVTTEPVKTNITQRPSREGPDKKYGISSDVGDKPFKNQFVDDGKAFAKDKLIDKKNLAKFPPVARDRTEVIHVEVTCGRCGKKEKVHPDLAPKNKGDTDINKYYICNDHFSGG